MVDTGVPLGLADLAAEPTTVGWFAFPAGSTLVLTTDGLTETRAHDGTFYPVDERLMKHLDLSPTELPLALHEDARAYAGYDRRARRRRRADRPPVTASLNTADSRAAGASMARAQPAHMLLMVNGERVEPCLASPVPVQARFAC